MNQPPFCAFQLHDQQILRVEVQRERAADSRCHDGAGANPIGRICADVRQERVNGRQMGIERKEHDADALGHQLTDASWIGTPVMEE